MTPPRPAPAATLAMDMPVSPNVAQSLATLLTFAPPALLFGVAGLDLSAERAWDRRRAPLAAEAARVLVECRSTAYTYDARIDESRGVYDVDCSAFVSLLLGRVAPTALARIPRAAGTAYPRAFEFYDLLMTCAPGWTPVPKLANLARGDVICWRLPPSPAGDTGHIAVASRTPVFDVAWRAWSVCVYDSSRVPHFDDSRGGAGAYRGGVGTGALRLRADVAGRPPQIQFGPGDTFHAHAILAARLDHATGHSTRRRGTLGPSSSGT